MMDYMNEMRDNWNSNAPSTPRGSLRISPLLLAALVIALPLAFIGWQLYVANNPAPHQQSLREATNELRASQGLPRL